MKTKNLLLDFQGGPSPLYFSRWWAVKYTATTYHSIFLFYIIDKVNLLENDYFFLLDIWSYLQTRHTIFYLQLISLIHSGNYQNCCNALIWLFALHYIQKLYSSVIQDLVNMCLVVSSRYHHILHQSHQFFRPIIFHLC